MRVGLTLILALALSCKGSEEDTPPGPTASPCTNVECTTAGVPSDACAEGLESDGARGCKPVLPAEPCTGNTFAYPGLTACATAGVDACPLGFTLGPNGCAAITRLDCTEHTIGALGGASCEPIQKCSTERYPATSGPTLHVDAAYTGTDSDGSADKPYAKLGDAIAKVDATKKTIAVARGSYELNEALAAPVEIVGACEKEVFLVGAKTATTATLSTFAEVTLRNVNVSGAAVGVSVERGTTRIFSSRVHNTGGIGGVVVKSNGVLELERVVVEGARGSGVAVMSGAATIKNSEVRRSVVDPSDRSGGVGIAALTSIKKQPRVTIARSIIAHNPLYGVYAQGADLALRESLVSNTGVARGPEAGGLLARAGSFPPKIVVADSVVEASAGFGIGCFDGTIEVDRTTVEGTVASKIGGAAMNFGVDPSTNKPAVAKVTRTTVMNTEELGLLVRGGNVDVGSTVIRSTRFGRSDVQERGVLAERVGNVTPVVQLHDSLIEKAATSGVGINAGTMTLERVAIRDITQSADNRFGWGAVVYLASEALRPTLTVKRSLIERVREAGLVSFGSRLEVDGSVIRDIVARENTGFYGMGVHFSLDPDTRVAADGFVHGAYIRDVLEAGINIFMSSAEIDTTTIDTVLTGEPGLFGDGITVAAVNDVEHLPTSATIRRTKIHKAARAALTVFEADVTMANVLATCNRLDIAVEDFLGVQAAKLTDEGNNLCGCESLGACRARSAALKPIKR